MIEKIIIRVSKTLLFTLILMVMLLGKDTGNVKIHLPQSTSDFESQAGISVKKSDQNSALQPFVLRLKEDLIIGREDDKRFVFYKVKDVKADAAGNIYILDSGNQRVQVFDRFGSFLRTIGRQGQGPGEFQVPTKIEIDTKTGCVFVKDVPNRIIVFKTDGTPKVNIFLAGLDDFVPLENDTLIAVAKNMNESDLSTHQFLCRINSNGAIIDKYIEVIQNIFMQNKPTGILVVKTGFEVGLQLARFDEKAFIYGYSQKYELMFCDNNGQILRKFSMNGPLPSFTKEEKKSFKDMPVPAQKPYYFSIQADPSGRIYVQRNKSIEIVRGRGPIDVRPKEVDVFSKEGDFLFKTTLPPNTCAIGEGVLYLYSLNEETGEEFVKRMRITNWSDMPVRIGYK